MSGSYIEFRRNTGQEAQHNQSGTFTSVDSDSVCSERTGVGTPPIRSQAGSCRSRKGAFDGLPGEEAELLVAAARESKKLTSF